MPSAFHAQTAKPTTVVWAGRGLAAAVIALLTLGSAAFSPRVEAADQAATATTELDVLADPAPDADVVLSVPVGTTVAIVGKPRGDYYPVAYAGINGWVLTGEVAVRVGATRSAATRDPRDGAGTATTTTAMNLRAGPNGGGVRGTVPAEANVVLTGRQADGLIEITHDGAAGWVPAQFLVAEGSPLPSEREPDRRPVGNRPADSGTRPGGPAPPPPGTFERAPAPSRETRRAAYTEQEIVRFINEAADRYGQSRRDMLRVARCESDLYPYAVGHWGERGIFQFMPSTFASTPYAGFDIYDAQAQANAAGWMWSVGRRNEWVCQ